MSKQNDAKYHDAAQHCHDHEDSKADRLCTEAQTNVDRRESQSLEKQTYKGVSFCLVISREEEGKDLKECLHSQSTPSLELR